MNRGHGFRGIILDLAIIAAVLCAGAGTVIVYYKHHFGQIELECKRVDYIIKHGLDNYNVRAVRAGAPIVFKFSLIDMSNVNGYADRIKKLAVKGDYVGGFICGHPPKYYKDYKAATVELDRLLKSLLINLSTYELVGMCILSGTVGGAIGFFGMWIVCLFLQWLVLSFVGEKPKNEQEQ